MENSVLCKLKCHKMLLTSLRLLSDMNRFYSLGVPSSVFLDFKLICSSILRNFNRFLEAGGQPQEFVEMLAENYHGMAQLANLFADWLIVAGTLDTRVYIGKYIIFSSFLN